MNQDRYPIPEVRAKWILRQNNCNDSQTAIELADGNWILDTGARLIYANTKWVLLSYASDQSDVSLYLGPVACDIHPGHGLVTNGDVICQSCRDMIRRLAQTKMGKLFDSNKINYRRVRGAKVAEEF